MDHWRTERRHEPVGNAADRVAERLEEPVAAVQRQKPIFSAGSLLRSVADAAAFLNLQGRRAIRYPGCPGDSGAANSMGICREDLDPQKAATMGPVSCALR